MRIFTHWLGVVLGQFWGIAEGDNGTIQDGNCGEKLSGKSWISTGKKGTKTHGVVVRRWNWNYPKKSKTESKKIERNEGFSIYSRMVDMVWQVPSWWCSKGFANWKCIKLARSIHGNVRTVVVFGGAITQDPIQNALKLHWFLKPWMLRCLLCFLGFLLFNSPWNLMILHPGGAREDLLSLTLFFPIKNGTKNQAFQSYYHAQTSNETQQTKPQIPVFLPQISIHFGYIDKHPKMPLKWHIPLKFYIDSSPKNHETFQELLYLRLQRHFAGPFLGSESRGSLPPLKTNMTMETSPFSIGDTRPETTWPQNSPIPKGN